MGSCEQGKQKTGKALQPACLMSVLVRAKTLSSPCRGDVSSGPAHTCGLVLALRVKRGTLIGRHVILNPRGWHGVLALSISRAARSTEGEVCLLPLRQRRPCPLKETQGRELHVQHAATRSVQEVPRRRLSEYTRRPLKGQTSKQQNWLPLAGRVDSELTGVCFHFFIALIYFSHVNTEAD